MAHVPAGSGNGSRRALHKGRTKRPFRVAWETWRPSSLLPSWMAAGEGLGLQLTLDSACQGTAATAPAQEQRAKGDRSPPAFQSADAARPCGTSRARELKPSLPLLLPMASSLWTLVLQPCAFLEMPPNTPFTLLGNPPGANGLPPFSSPKVAALHLKSWPQPEGTQPKSPPTLCPWRTAYMAAPQHS